MFTDSENSSMALSALLPYGLSAALGSLLLAIVGAALLIRFLGPVSGVQEALVVGCMLLFSSMTVCVVWLLAWRAARLSRPPARPYQSDKALADECNLLRSVINGLPHVVYAKDSEHRFILANQATADLFNLDSPENVIGKTDFDLFPAQDAQRFQTRERHLLEIGEPSSIDWTRATPPVGEQNGSERWLRGYKALLHGPSGGVIGIVCEMQDITEQRHAEDALRASEERYRLLFEESPVSLWEEDYSAIKQRLERLQADGIDDLYGYLSAHPEEVAACLSELRVLDVNLTAVRMYGAADKNELIQNLPRIIPLEHRASLIESFVSVAEGRTHIEQEVVDITFAGERLFLYMHLLRLPTAREDEFRFLVALVNITERKQLEAAVYRQSLLLDQISDAVIATDKNFVIHTWNRAAETIYGWHPSEAIGKTVAQLMSTRYRVGSTQEVMSAFSRDGYWEGEVEQTRKDGSVLPILSAVTLIRDGKGKPIGSVGVNRNMTELRKAEAVASAMEERYRHLFDEAPVMYLVVKEQDGLPVVGDVNSAYLETLGYTRDEVIGRHGMDFLTPASQQGAQAIYQRIMDGATVVTERALLTRDGRQIDTLIRAVPEFDAAGRPVGILTMYTDITQRKKSERDLQIESNRVQTLLRVASRLNRQSDLPSVMHGICEEVSMVLNVTGVSFSLVDKERNLFVHGADVGLPSGYPQRTKPIPVPPHLSGDLSLTELIQIRPINTLTQSPNYAMYLAQGLQIAVNVILVRDMQLVGSLNLHITDPKRRFTPEDTALLRGVADVITQAILNAQLWEDAQRHTEKLEILVAERTNELVAALAEAQEADRIKSQFVSDINHELRTPLTNLTLYLELLTKGRPEKREQAIAIMQRETLRLRQLIEEVLDLSRLDLGNIHVQPRSVNLNQLIQDLLTDREELIVQSSLPVTFQPEADLASVMGDPDLITRVVSNLLGNALNYCRQGQIRIETGQVRVDDTDWQTIRIVDSGPGIDPEDLPHLFERFYRGQSARQTGASGTGLGLSICQEIAQRHNGSITVDSEYGKGSTFSLWLPAQNA